jgi:hypothetical protein
MLLITYFFVYSADVPGDGRAIAVAGHGGPVDVVGHLHHDDSRRLQREYLQSQTLASRNLFIHHCHHSGGGFFVILKQWQANNF